MKPIINFHFSEEVALKSGILAAVLYDSICFWVRVNEENGNNFYKGRSWCYNSVKAWGQIFKFATPKQLRTALEKLEEDGWIESNIFHKETGFHTKHYTVSSKALAPQGNSTCPTGQKALAPQGKSTITVTNNTVTNNISGETPEPPFSEIEKEMDLLPKDTPPTAAAPPPKKSKRSSDFSNIDESYVLAFNAGIARAGGTPTVRRSDKLKAKDLKDTIAALDIGQAEGWIEESGGAKEFLNVLGFRHFSRLKDFSAIHALSLETARRNIEKSWSWRTEPKRQPNFGRGASVSTFESGRTEEQTNEWLAQRIARTKEIQEKGVKNGEPNAGADS